MKTKIFRNSAFLFTIVIILLVAGCKTTPKVTEREPKQLSRNLSDPALLSAEDLFNFFMSQNPDADSEMVKRLCGYYIEEAKTEGINSDCAFAQMCLETGFLRFGNLVKPEMHNYCGLGAIDAEHPGEVFETEQLGVRAHIQHLHAYAKPEMHNYCGLGAIDAEHPGEVFETEQLGVRAHIQHLHAYAKPESEENALKNELIDKRYKWVNPKGKAPTIFELAGTWASDRAYGEKLDAILERMAWF